MRFATKNGTAKAGDDYRRRSGTVTFGPGDATKKVKVLILPDTRDEATERFSLVLSNPVEARIADGKGTATIKDND